ncbi:MAG TPA: hypothetical protein VJ916_06465 [Anaerovoracaceae bacterium]|nr:hypothetical protein [Anaerovoracaceae bacterium]
MVKKCSVKEIDISLSKIILVISIGTAFCFGGILLNQPILIVLGGITFLFLLTRKFAYVDADGLVNVKDFRMFKKYEKWPYEDIESIRFEDELSMDDCLIRFERSLDAKSYTFSKEDALEIIKATKEKNPKIKQHLH